MNLTTGNGPLRHPLADGGGSDMPLADRTTQLFTDLNSTKPNSDAKREQAAFALRDLADKGELKDPEAARELGKAMGDRLMTVRQAVAHSLAKMTVNEAHTVVFDALTSENDYTCETALWAVNIRGEHYQNFALIIREQLLTHEQPRIREVAAETLGKMGPDAKESLDALIDRYCEKETEPRVRDKILIAIRSISSVSGKEAESSLTEEARSRIAEASERYRTERYAAFT